MTLHRVKHSTTTLHTDSLAFLQQKYVPLTKLIKDGDEQAYKCFNYYEARKLILRYNSTLQNVTADQGATSAYLSFRYTLAWIMTAELTLA